MQEDKNLLQKVLQNNHAMEYVPIKSITIQNFMSVEEAVLEFDETNIINLKGYNDSGKSAVLRAFEVCLENKYQQNQSKFIMDGKTYFRIMVEFTDGTLILRDRYVNNQSLYEMYNNGTLLFSTKQNGVLTKVTKVPDVIENYIGMLHCKGTYVQSRSCFDKQFLVETSGKENAETLNIILKNEELAYATSLLNNDKNEKASQLKAKETEMNLTKQMIYDCKVITEGMLQKLRATDEMLDLSEIKKTGITSMTDCIARLDSIQDIPELEPIETGRLDGITGIAGILEQLDSIQDIPEMHKVDDTQLSMLQKIDEAVDKLSEIQDIPEMRPLDTDRTGMLGRILETLDRHQGTDAQLNELDRQEEQLRTELESLEMELNNSGIKVVKCENCGNLIEVDIKGDIV